MPAQARIVLVWGLLILVMAVLNTVMAQSVTPELQRAEVLSAVAAVSLLLVAVLWTRADPRSAARQELGGEQGLVLASDLSDAVRDELGWGSHMLLTATAASTVLVYWKGIVLLRRGLISDGDFHPGTICRRVMQKNSSVSLVSTALFPGRGEFDPVLDALPSVLICPLGGDGVVVIGGWSERCFSRSDERWAEGWAVRLRTALQGIHSVADGPVPPV
tara:strand:- start:204 stop:857 length:654 start_codon:yes stop_codon:yes gene_type:complete